MIYVTYIIFVSAIALKLSKVWKIKQTFNKRTEMLKIDISTLFYDKPMLYTYSDSLLKKRFHVDTGGTDFIRQSQCQLIKGLTGITDFPSIIRNPGLYPVFLDPESFY